MSGRAGRVAPVVVLVLAMTLLVAGCSGGGAKAMGAKASTSAAARATVIYQVTGNAPQVAIRYGNRHHNANVQTKLPWSHQGSAFEGTTVVLDANQPRSRYGYRLRCTLSVRLPGHDAIVSRDSSHIVGIKQEGGPQKILYDGTCNTAQVVSLTGLP